MQLPSSESNIVRVLLEDELHAQAKSRAALEGVSLAAWITDHGAQHATENERDKV